MENFEHSEEMDASKFSYYEAKPYVPQYLNYEDEENPDDILEQLEDAPQGPDVPIDCIKFDDIPDGEKEDVKARARQKQEEIISGVEKIINNKLPNENRMKHILDLVNLFGKNSKIIYSSPDRRCTIREIQQFFENVKDGSVSLDGMEISIEIDRDNVHKIKQPDGTYLYDPKIKSIEFSKQ